MGGSIRVDRRGNSGSAQNLARVLRLASSSSAVKASICEREIVLRTSSLVFFEVVGRYGRKRRKRALHCDSGTVGKPLGSAPLLSRISTFVLRPALMAASSGES